MCNLQSGVAVLEDGLDLRPLLPGGPRPRCCLTLDEVSVSVGAVLTTALPQSDSRLRACLVRWPAASAHDDHRQLGSELCGQQQREHPAAAWPVRHSHQRRQRRRQPSLHLHHAQVRPPGTQRLVDPMPVFIPACQQNVVF